MARNLLGYFSNITPARVLCRAGRCGSLPPPRPRVVVQVVEVVEEVEEVEVPVVPVPASVAGFRLLQQLCLTLPFAP